MVAIKNNILSSQVRRNFKRLTPLWENKRNNTYLTAILSLLTLSFFGVFAIKPTLTTGVSLNNEINQLRDLNSKYEAKITDIVKAQGEYESIRDDIPLIFLTLPDSPQFSKLIINEENIASSSSLTLDHLSVEPVPISKTSSVGKLGRFSLSMALTGDYTNVYKYVSHFLRSQRMVSMDGLDIERKGASTSGQLDLNIQGTSYYEP